MSEQAVWDYLHTTAYAAAEWSGHPSLFAEWAVEYFPPNGSVLEVGAGQGQDSRFFAERGYSVTATDFSPEALKRAAQKPHDLLSVRFVDLSQSLPFEDTSFDVVYAHLSLHFFDASTTERLFGEIRRVLRSGGILAALFNSTNDPHARQGQALEGPEYRDLGELRKRFFTPESARFFAKAFDIVVADDEGVTYKDGVKGVANLVRLVARKD